MTWRKSGSECRNCYRAPICPEENPENKVTDYIDWMKKNCPQYPKK